MRTRRDLAPALQTTLLGLFATLAPWFNLPAQPLPILRDVTREAGLNLVTTCGTPEKKFIIEGNGSGCAWIDYDNDGWTDLYVVNGISSAALMAGREDPASAPNFLFRNRGNGTFTQVTVQAGVPGTGLGNGVAAADYDNDGWTDLFVTNYGRDLLYRNNGNGTFTEVGASAGVAGEGEWSTGAAFGDYDGDGWLDLYVARYLEFDVDESSPQRGVLRIPRPPGHVRSQGAEGIAGCPVPKQWRRNLHQRDSGGRGVTDDKLLYGFSPVFDDFDNDGDSPTSSSPTTPAPITTVPEPAVTGRFASLHYLCGSRVQRPGDGPGGHGRGRGGRGR